jgi:N-acetylglutamate synthase/N-acetylornithine aminotransferase
VCRELALAIVRGGEGATKLVTVNVTGAGVERRGAQGGQVIANSLLGARPRSTAAIRTGDGCI